MERKHMIIAAAVAAALVVFFIWRRRASAVLPATGPMPSPQTALAVLQATPPSTLAREAINYGVGQLLPVVGQGVNAILPQSTAAPECMLTQEQQQGLAKIAPGPGRDAVIQDWCRVNAEKAAGTYKPTGFAATLANISAAVRAQQR